MTKATTAQVNAIITQYLNNYKVKYGNPPINFNRYKEKWGFQSIIDDLGYPRAKEVIDWYFTTSKWGHPVMYLLYNYGDMNEEMIEEAEDEAARTALRAESKIRVEAWKAEHGN